MAEISSPLAQAPQGLAANHEIFLCMAHGLRIASSFALMEPAPGAGGIPDAPADVVVRWGAS